MELLKQKVEMGILEPLSAPYSNRWFIVPKKNGTLRFIQDLQPVNKVTSRNAGIRTTIDEFAEAFAGRLIYSVGDLYSGYDQFQLVVESRDITTMWTPLGLVRMCTLPQGGTNSVAHMVNAMPFLDNIPIKGCTVEERDETIGLDGCRKFVATHVDDCEKVLQRLEGARLTFSGKNRPSGNGRSWSLDTYAGHTVGNHLRSRWKPSPR